MLTKFSDKLAYLLFLFLLDLTFLEIRFILSLTKLLHSRERKGDIILYPYAFPGSDGYIRRFEEYFPYLNRDGISYKVCNIFTDDYVSKQLTGSKPGQYLFYLRVIWKRIPQVLEARHYHAAFVQRGLFPLYFDLEYPHLERLLRKLNKHITIDFWDSVFERQGMLVRETVNFADQLSLSNEFLMNHFSDFPGKRVLWKIAVNLDKYCQKEDYSITGKTRLFWTGLPHNLSFLKSYLPVLAEISVHFPLVLVMVCKKPIQYQGLEIEHHHWAADTFFKLLKSADIGIYPEFNSVVSKGKSTMKVMDYLAAGLPMIGVPYGLPTEVENGRELLIARDFNEWKKMLMELIQDEQLRKNLGRQGRLMVEKYYSLDKSYEVFTSFALNQHPNLCAE